MASTGEATPAAAANEDYRALRISQLDASELDSELYELMREQVKNVLKYIKPGLLTTLAPEVNATLRSVLWAFSLRVAESTIGQGLLQLRYKDETAPGTQWINRKQKLLFAICQILGPWLQERSADLALWTRNYPRLAGVWAVLGRSEKFWKVASLLNFLIFLRKGNYQFLTERILGVRAVFPRRMGARQVSFEYMDREMLWHGFAEFLFFVLPLINFRKVMNYLRRTMAPSLDNQPGMEGQQPQRDYAECAACGEAPVNVHDMGCRHVFCYVCLMGNLCADPAYSCPLCGQTVDTIDCIKPVMVRTQVLDKDTSL